MECRGLKAAQRPIFCGNKDCNCDVSATVAVYQYGTVWLDGLITPKARALSLSPSSECEQSDGGGRFRFARCHANRFHSTLSDSATLKAEPSVDVSRLSFFFKLFLCFFYNKRASAVSLQEIYCTARSLNPYSCSSTHSISLLLLSSKF